MTSTSCLHPLPLRIWHWTNAGIFIILTGTGLYMRLHGISTLKPHDPVLQWHKYTGFAMIALIIFWFAHVLWSGNLRRHYAIGKRDVGGMKAQAHYYLFAIFSGGKNPFTPTAREKYNPLQKMAYGAVMVIFLPTLGITGFLFLDIPVLRDYLLSKNLVRLVDAFHVILSYMVFLFFIVHVYMATLGETAFSYTRAMIVGYEERSDGIEDVNEQQFQKEIE